MDPAPGPGKARYTKIMIEVPSSKLRAAISSDRMSRTIKKNYDYHGTDEDDLLVLRQMTQTHHDREHDKDQAACKNPPVDPFWNLVHRHSASIAACSWQPINNPI